MKVLTSKLLIITISSVFDFNFYMELGNSRSIYVKRILVYILGTIVDYNLFNKLRPIANQHF